MILQRTGNNKYYTVWESSPSSTGCLTKLWVLPVTDTCAKPYRWKIHVFFVGCRDVLIFKSFHNIYVRSLKNEKVSSTNVHPISVALSGNLKWTKSIIDPVCQQWPDSGIFAGFDAVWEGKWEIFERCFFCFSSVICLEMERKFPIKIVKFTDNLRQ